MQPKLDPTIGYSLINVSAVKPEPIVIPAKMIYPRMRTMFKHRPKEPITCECGQTMQFRNYGRHLDECRNRKPDLSLFGKGLYFSTRNRIKHDRTKLAK